MSEHHSVVGAIFSQDRKQVLLILRRDLPVWVLPGGGVEEGESYEESILREVWEETGLQVKIQRKVGEYWPINRLAHYTHLYECIPLQGSLTTGAETKELHFFDIENLPFYLPPPYKEWIEEALSSPAFIRRPLSSITYQALAKQLFFHPILVIRFLLQKVKKAFFS